MRRSRRQSWRDPRSLETRWGPLKFRIPPLILHLSRSLDVRELHLKCKQSIRAMRSERGVMQSKIILSGHPNPISITNGIVRSIRNQFIMENKLHCPLLLVTLTKSPEPDTRMNINKSCESLNCYLSSRSDSFLETFSHNSLHSELHDSPPHIVHCTCPKVSSKNTTFHLTAKLPQVTVSFRD